MCSIGKEGHEPGELYYPTDVSFANGLLYVADAYNNRLQVFDLVGKLQRIIVAGDSIRTATGLTVSGGRLFVADFENSRLLVYDLEGNLLQQITGNLAQPTDIAAAEDKIFVANYGSNSVVVFRKE